MSTSENDEYYLIILKIVVTLYISTKGFQRSLEVHGSSFEDYWILMFLSIIFFVFICLEFVGFIWHLYSCLLSSLGSCWPLFKYLVCSILSLPSWTAIICFWSAWWPFFFSLFFFLFLWLNNFLCPIFKFAGSFFYLLKLTFGLL